LTNANLSAANLHGTYLIDAVLNGTTLKSANLTGATFESVKIINTSFKDVIGLEHCRHLAPSSIDKASLELSGPLPEILLRGLGLSDDLVAEFREPPPRRIRRTKWKDLDLADILIEPELLEIALKVFTDKHNFGHGIENRYDKRWGKSGKIFSQDEFRAATIDYVCEKAMFAVVVQIQGYRYPGGMGDGSDQPEDAARFWKNFKSEFKVLLCTRDKKYADVRSKFKTLGSKSQITLTSTIAAALAPHLGIAAGLLVPFCAICLVAALRLGRAAFCKSLTFDVPVAPSERLS